MLSSLEQRQFWFALHIYTHNSILLFSEPKQPPPVACVEDKCGVIVNVFSYGGGNGAMSWCGDVVG